MAVSVATLAAPNAAFLSGLEALRGPVTVVRRCEELAEALAVSESGLAQALVIADRLPELTGTVLQRVAASGAPVVVLTGDEAQVRRLSDLGAIVVPSSIEAAALASLIESAVRERRLPLPVSSAAEADDDGAQKDEAAAHADERTARIVPVGRRETTPWSIQDAAQEQPDTAGRQEGLVIAVWGPAGAPGRSTISVNLAAELAAEVGPVWLVDADTYASSTAVMLGLLDESAPLAQACRLADQGGLDEAALIRVSSQVMVSGGRLRALTGITRADRWPEIRSSALASVLELCRATARATVIDCSFCLEADEELSFDTIAPRRNGATLQALETADQVIAVGAADALGVPRLVKGIEEMREMVPTANPRIVINKVRDSSVGRGARRQLDDAWQRYGPDVPIEQFLPWDPQNTDAAVLSGSVLREIAPNSALRQAIRALAPADLHLDSAGADGARKSGGLGRLRRPSRRMSRENAASRN